VIYVTDVFLVLTYLSCLHYIGCICVTNRLTDDILLARVSRAYATMSVSVCLWWKCIGAL